MFEWTYLQLVLELMSEHVAYLASHWAMGVAASFTVLWMLNNWNVVTISANPGTRTAYRALVSARRAAL